LAIADCQLAVFSGAALRRDDHDATCAEMGMIGDRSGSANRQLAIGN
jgi:hypothetical protein